MSSEMVTLTINREDAIFLLRLARRWWALKLEQQHLAMRLSGNEWEKSPKVAALANEEGWNALRLAAHISGPIRRQWNDLESEEDSKQA